MIGEAVRKHFDPDGTHIPNVSVPLDGDGDAKEGEWGLVNEFAWYNPGTPSVGDVQVVLTTPNDGTSEPSSGDSNTYKGTGTFIGCDPPNTCERVPMPDGEGHAWVTSSGPNRQVFGAMHRRANGVVVAISLHAGNHVETLEDKAKDVAHAEKVMERLDEKDRKQNGN